LEVIVRRYYKNFSGNSAIEMARYRVNKIRRFYLHLFIYAIGLTIYVLKTYYGVPFNFPPIHYITFIFMEFWTLFIVIKAISLFVTEMVFGDEWEQRKVEAFMYKDKKANRE